MDELMNIIKGRRSTRIYHEKDIPKQFLEQLLESIKWCPSWANTQCWEVIVVKDLTIKKSLQETLPKMNPARKAITQAPITIALCGKLKSSGYYKDQVTTKFGDWFMFDLGIAAQTLCLTAHGLGLGTVIVGMFEHDRAKKILKVGDKYELVALIPIGYPAKDTPVSKRREINDFVHYETF